MANHGDPTFGTQLSQPTAKFGVQLSFSYILSLVYHDVFGAASAFSPFCNTSLYRPSLDFNLPFDLWDFAHEFNLFYPDQFTALDLVTALGEITHGKCVVNTTGTITPSLVKAPAMALLGLPNAAHVWRL